MLATYQDPHLCAWPAVTTHVHGIGRIMMVGTVPDQELARALFAWAVPRPVHGWPDLPAPVRGTRTDRAWPTYTTGAGAT